ncbi:MAG: glycosyltransferase family 4 protein [Ahniella sp.]|nr:glycosyltransferase family 4 protein [Ahniella sp.]
MNHDICFVGLENLPVLAREFNHLGAGGEQVQQTLLSRALVRRGYRVCMVVLDHGQADGAVWDGVTTFRAYRPEAGIGGLRFIHPRWTGIWSALSRANASTYYVSCAGMRVGLVAMFCCLRRRRLVFRTASDSDCCPDRLLVSYARDRRLYEYGLRHADSILTQSASQHTNMLLNYGHESTVAGMLVDAPESAKDFADRDIDVLWVNNFQGLKRPDRFIDLARRLPERHFVMIGGAGPGGQQLFDSIKEQAESCSNVTFLGRIPYHDVNEYYARAKVFVNTSDIEGFPNSYLQAWIRGVPVVTFIDPDDVISRQNLGAAARDPDGMYLAVRSLLADHALWTKASEDAKAFMASEFDESAILRPYLDAMRLEAGVPAS